MLKFVDLQENTPTKESALILEKIHFKEIYARYAKDKALEQASRCSQCGSSLLSNSLSFTK